MGIRFPWSSCLSLLLLAAASASDAQTLPGAATAAPSEAPASVAVAPEVIAAADIPARADADERFAKNVRDDARQADPTAAFEPRLLALARSVGIQSELFKDKDLKLLPVVRLESIERHWRFFRRQADAWRTGLNQATEQSLSDAAELGRRKAAWAATAAAAEIDPLPAALLARIKLVQASLLAAEEVISPPIDRQTRLNRRANAVEAQIDDGQKAISAAIAYNDSRLVRIDAPALWTASARQAGTASRNSLETGLAAEAEFLQDYGRANNLGSSVLSALILALLPLLLWLSRHSRKFSYDDPQVQVSMRVLQRPFASWMLLAATSVLVWEPEAPIILHQFALFVALIPVLRLLPPRIYEALGAWPVVATVLYLLNLLGFVFAGNEYYHRLYLLGLTLLSVALLAWLQWRGRGNVWVRDAVWGAMGLLVISAVANVVGNVSLAEMLTGALLFSGYVGLVLYAGVNVMDSIMRLLLTRGRVAKLPMIKQYARTLFRGINWLLRVTALLGWLAVALNQFRILRPLYHAVSAILGHPFGIGQISLTLGSLVTFFISVFLSFWLAKTTRYVLKDDVLPNMSLPRGVANSVASLSYYALLLLGLLVALAAAGFQLSQLTLVIGALGVGIGLGLQNVVNNFVSGLILMFERPIQPGDVVEVAGASGTVRDIGMRATTLATFDGADVVVPNGTLLSEKLTNWTLSNLNRRMEVSVGVAYGCNPEEVLALLLKVARETEGVAEEPEPSAFFTGFGASSLDFNLRAWTNQYGDWLRTKSNLSVNVYKGLTAAGIKIPFPQTDLHVSSVAPEVRALLRKEAPGTGDEAAAKT